MVRKCMVLMVGTLILGALAPAAWPKAAPRLPDIASPKVVTDAPEIGKYGGTYVISVTSDPRTFNPVVAEEVPSLAAFGPLIDGLVEVNYLTGDIEPALAESWTVSQDGRTWTYTLRQGVRWSDGKPLTMDDILISLQAVFTEGVHTSKRDQLTFDGKPVRYTRLDDRRIQFTTENPVGLFARLIGGLNIIPKHKLGPALSKGGAEFNKSWGVNTSPRELVGTGPFVLQSYVPGERLTYLRNPSFWKVDRQGNRLPYLARYVILIVPTQAAQRLKFLAKETDFYNATPREFAEFKQGESGGNYTIYDGPETFFSLFLVLNQNPRGISAPKLTWFQDARFRRALNHAIDRSTLSQQVYTGRATPAWGPVSVGIKQYANPNLPTYPYDLNRAQQLLAEGGYRKGPDGFLHDGQGNIVEFSMSARADDPDRVASGNILRQDFSKLGIKVNYEPEAFNTQMGKLTGTFKWDAIIIGLTGGGIEPATSRNVWLSSGSLHMWSPKQQKPATEWEAEIDRLFEQMAREISQEKRKQLYFRWQEIVAQQAPVMYFTYPKTQPAVRNTLGNIKIGLQGQFGRLGTLYYKTAYR